MEKDLKKKFDICLMNPPYNNGLCNKFFIKCLDICNKVVTVQPLSWLLSKHQNKRLTSKIDGHYSTIDKINGNNYFDAGLFANVSINYINLTQKGNIKYVGNEYEKCSDIKTYSQDKYLVEFVDKLGVIKDNIWEHIKHTDSYGKGYEPNPNNNWYCIKIAQIRGNVGKGKLKYSDNFYTIISNDDKFMTTQIGLYKKLKETPNKNGKFNFGYFAFNNEQQLNNFINYIKTDFVRTCLRILKIHSNQFRGCLSNIPWQDFSNDVFNKSPREIDDYLFKKYNINNQLKKHLQDSLPDYYGIRE